MTNPGTHPFDCFCPICRGESQPRQDDMDPDPPWAGACTGKVVCEGCGKFHGYCDVVSEQKEKSVRIPKPERGASTGRVPFLAPKDVGRMAKATITKVEEAPGYMQFSDYCIHLKIGSKVFIRGEKFSSMNTRAITEKYGDRTEKWVGKTITLRTADWFNARQRKTQKIITVEVKSK